jgi:hypothetical protein
VGTTLDSIGIGGKKMGRNITVADKFHFTVTSDLADILVDYCSEVVKFSDDVEVNLEANKTE